MFPELLNKKLLVAKRGDGMIGLPPGQGRDYSYPVLPNTVAMLPSVDGLGLAVPLGAGNTPVDPDTHDRVPTAEDKADVLARTAFWFPALKGQPIINARCVSSKTRWMTISSSTNIPGSTTCGWQVAGPFTDSSSARSQATTWHTASLGATRILSSRRFSRSSNRLSPKRPAGIHLSTI